MQFEKWMDRHDWADVGDNLYTNGRLYVLKAGDSWIASKTPDTEGRWAREFTTAEEGMKYAEGKMKPRTSSKVNQRYHKKAYSQLGISYPKPFVAEIKKWAADHNRPLADVVRAALIKYMEEEK